MLRRDDRERCSRTKVTELKVEKSLILQKLKNLKLSKIIKFSHPDHCKLLIFHQNHQRNNVCHGNWPKKSFPNFRFFMIFVIFLILNNNSQRKLKLLHPL